MIHLLNAVRTSLDLTATGCGGTLFIADMPFLVRLRYPAWVAR